MASAAMLAVHGVKGNCGSTGAANFMKLPVMTNELTRAHLIMYCERGGGLPFSWPTDACGYDQHIKFVKHRNANWQGGDNKAWLKFVRDYAESLLSAPQGNPRDVADQPGSGADSFTNS